jgi:hypothetical protein
MAGSRQYVGWLVGGDKAPPMRCRVSDVSRSEARIRSFGSMIFPDVFTLHFARSGQLQVKCRVRSQAACEARVEFIGS